MINPLTKKTYESLCSQWAEIIKSKGESGIQMWPPIGGAFLRIQQFLADKALQKKLLKDLKPLYIVINADEFEDYSYDHFQNEVEQVLHKKISTFNLERWLEKQKKKIVVFITGLDSSIRKGNIELILKLGTILQKYIHLSVILTTEINIIDVPLFKKLSTRVAFLQNIFYQSLYDRVDDMQFLAYLEEKWDISISSKLKEQIVEKIGSHYFVIKEAVRTVRKNRHATIEEILSSATLIKKGLAQFHLLIPNDQDLVVRMLKGQKNVQASEYLTQTKIIQDNILGMRYWYQIKNKILKDVNNIRTYNNELNLDFYLTTIERNVFELLQDSKHIVSRDLVAKTIWANNWEEQYSDWAIDQMIHRVRGKIKMAKVPYEIKTKKGFSFILLSK